MTVDRVAFMVLSVALLASPPCVAQFKSPRWPAGTKEAAIAGCRDSLLRQTEQDFLKRNNLKEMPAGVREKLVQTIEPFLAVCDCAMNRIEKERSFEYFSSHQPEMLAELQVLTAGECAPASSARTGKDP